MSIDQPLSDQDILSIVPQCRFIPYDQIHQIQSIDQLLPKTLLLYRLARVGHWCCLFENEEGMNFFDPLGYKPDEELLLASPEYVKRYHQDYTWLIRLLLQSHRPVIYNQYPLQAKGTSTCGHWCTLRMLCSEMSNDQFARMFSQYKSRDRDRIVARVFSAIQNL